MSEAVFHSIQIRTKKNRGEEAKGKKEEEAADFVGYLFHFFFISLSCTKGLAGSFFSWSIESNIEERNENEMKKKEKLLYT